jgi:hypothetical protein
MQSKAWAWHRVAQAGFAAAILLSCYEERPQKQAPLIVGSSDPRGEAGTRSEPRPATTNVPRMPMPTPVSPGRPIMPPSTAGAMSPPCCESERSVCGNGIVEIDEQCEPGWSLPTCSELFGRGATGLVVCADSCSYDLSGCLEIPLDEDAGLANCIPGEGCVERDGSYGVCSLPRYSCVDCSSDAQCSALFDQSHGLCIRGRCRQCDDTHACPSGQFCDDNICLVPF